MMTIVLWSLATLAVFLAARRLFQRTRIHVLHPVLVSTFALIALVELAGRRYPDFNAGTAWLAWMLGPGVVAMAVPVYRLRQVIFARAVPLVLIVGAALAFSLATTAGLLLLCGAGRDLVISLSLKNITAAVAMGIAREVQANPVLAGVGAMFSAVLGSALGPWVLARAGVRFPPAVGLALGAGSHAVGTARAFEIGEEHGTYASVGLALTTLIAALVCPALFLLFS